MEQPADWIEQEVQRILEERGKQQPVQFFRDFVPEEEEHLYPGQGTAGAGMDYVPEGYTATSWLARQRMIQQNENLLAIEENNAAIETADRRAQAQAAAASGAKRVGRAAKGHGAAKASAA